MESNRIEIVAIRPGERSKLNERSRKERRVLERSHHLSVARRRRRKIVLTRRAVGKGDPQPELAEGLPDTTSIIGRAGARVDHVHIRRIIAAQAPQS